MSERLPWEIVETLPSTDPDLIERWARALAAATTEDERVGGLVGRALSLYWAPATGATDDSWAGAADRREALVAEALGIARASGDPELVATALLGGLYATWGPPRPDERRAVLDELESLRPDVRDRELRVRIVEWHVLDRFDAGDLAAVRRWVAEFMAEAEGMDSKLFRRREVLWRANLEMLEGNLDEAVRLNEDAIASTADLAGSPFSFQNVAITIAIAQYFRRGLGEVVDAIRSIRASSPRVETNWDVGLAFALSEVGELDEARSLFDRLAIDRFAAVPRDLNWLVAMQLLGLIACNLDDGPRAEVLLEELRPFAALDATHGSGYASYGPVGLVVGMLAERLGRRDEADAHLDHVLASRSPGPWTTLARVARARDDLAVLDRAVDELRGFGMGVRADEAAARATRLRLDGHGGPVARRTDGVWTFAHPQGRAEVRDGVGVRHLVRLLGRPGETVDVLDLDIRIDPAMPRTTAVESSLDPAAREAYRRRLAELDQAPARTGDEEAEREFLRRELAGGAHHVSVSREIEKARVRVTTALRRAIAAVAEASAPLGEHLSSTVETGRRCSYQPADGEAWRVEE